MDENITVKYNDSFHILKDVIEECEPGETIEGLDIIYFDELLIILEKKRDKKYSYGVDRRYGNWRFILFGTKK